MAEPGKIKVRCCSFCSSGETVVPEESDDIRTLHRAVMNVAVDIGPDVVVHATVQAIRKFISEFPHPLFDSNSVTWDDETVTKTYRQTILDALDIQPFSPDHTTDD